MLRREPGRRYESGSSSPARIYCQTHPSYQAKRKPNSQCAACHELYGIKEAVYDAVAASAKAINKQLAQDVTVVAKFDLGVQFGRNNTFSAISMRIEKI